MTRTSKQSALMATAVTTALFIVSLFVITLIGDVQAWPVSVWILLLVLVVDSHKDRLPGTWRHFLPIGLGVLLAGYLLYFRAPWWWWQVVRWRTHSLPHIWFWNEPFRVIPWNDGAWFRESPLFTWFRTSAVTKLMRWVYVYGYALSVWGSVIRSFFTRDVRKMLAYTLSTHVLQFLLIVPFYALISLDEVWWVLHHPNPFGPLVNPGVDVELVVQNCFPSMHTSVCFAVLLLALRERGRIFKYVMVAYMAGVIYSTVYLEIHWLLDVVAGLLFGWGAVALSDWLLSRLPVRRPAPQAEPEVA